MALPVYCDIDHSEMTLKEIVPSNKNYRIRRYICPMGHEKTVWAGGFRDGEHEEPRKRVLDEPSEEMGDIFNE